MNKRRIWVESLEDRAMLSSDGITTPANDHVCTKAPNNPNCAVIGDANGDGQFDFLDLDALEAGGKLDTGECAEWAEGDFNRDGLADENDLIFAFTDGQFFTPAEFARKTFIPGLAGKTCAPGRGAAAVSASLVTQDGSESTTEEAASEHQELRIDALMLSYEDDSETQSKRRLKGLRSDPLV